MWETPSKRKDDPTSKEKSKWKTLHEKTQKKQQDTIIQNHTHQK